MLSSDFSNELGALLRSLEAQVRFHPEVMHEEYLDTLDHIDRAIVSLVAIRIRMKRLASEMEK